MKNSRRPQVLLTLGVAAGVIAAAAGLLRTDRTVSGALPAGVVARVNGQPLASDVYERAVNALAQDRKSELTEADRRFVLDRLIDEELLLQRALELGLARDDPRTRNFLTSALISSVVANSDGVQPTDAELQTFYDGHRDFFTGAGRVRVQQIWFRASTPQEASAAFERAQQALTRLRAGEDFAAVKASLGDQEIAPLPDAPLPITKLADYVGPTATRTALTLEPRAFSDPVRSQSGYHVLQVIERIPGDAAPLADIKPQVLAEYRRRAADDALRAYIDDLRSRADITVAPRTK
jgi:parvulin-like peptidyl-prolyl isomerase